MNANPTDGIEVDISIEAGDACMTMQNRQQEREPLGIQANTEASRLARMGLIHQCLYLDEQGASSLLRDHHGRAGDAVCGRGAPAELGLREKEGRRIGHGLEPTVGHGKDTELIDRAESVLDRPHHPKGSLRVALKVEHCIDHVLQNTRPSKGAFFCDVAHQKEAASSLLGPSRELGSALPDLRHRAGQGPNLIRENGLDGINHNQLRLGLLEERQDLLQVDLRQDLDPFKNRLREAKPTGPQCYLISRLLT